MSHRITIEKTAAGRFQVLTNGVSYAIHRDLSEARAIEVAEELCQSFRKMGERSKTERIDASADNALVSIRYAIEQSAQAQGVSNESATDIWKAAHGAMKSAGMMLFDKPMTVDMLNRQIDETQRFEQGLAEAAQELNEVLFDFDHAATQAAKVDALKGLVNRVRNVVNTIEQSNPNWPLQKPVPAEKDGTPSMLAIA